MADMLSNNKHLNQLLKGTVLLWILTEDESRDNNVEGIKHSSEIKSSIGELDHS